MKNKVSILLVVAVVLAVTSVSLAQTCDPPCANGGICVADNTCQCPEGFSGSTCLQKTCGHGSLSPETNYCTCESGWFGQDCLVCQDDAACKAVGKGTCSTSVIVESTGEQKQKYFSCKVLGPMSVYLGDNVTWDCNLNTQSCSLQTWFNYENKQQELFWCRFDSCSMNVDTESHMVSYACTKSFCACTDLMPCNEILKKILDGVKGSGSLNCATDKQSCSFKHSNFPFGTVPLECIGGMCQ